MSGYSYQGLYGMNYRVKEKITVADLSFRVQHVIKTETDITLAQLSRNGIEVITGAASFLDAHRLRVESTRGQSEFEADVIVIAVGTRPAESPTVPINNRTIITSDQIFSLVEIPKTLLVVGGAVWLYGGEPATVVAAVVVTLVALVLISRWQKYRSD